jgi:septal ring factor EnvC (AmiA/AmiB activator)
MGETASVRFEEGARAFMKRWAGVGAIIGSIVLAAVGGSRHLDEIENKIDRVERNQSDAEKRIVILEASSTRDREAIVRIEVQVLHMAEILRRIEDKIDKDRQ